MDKDRRQEVRDRAYRIWEEQGRPEGRHEDHWREAEKAFEGEVPDATAEGKPARKPDLRRPKPVEPGPANEA